MTCSHVTVTCLVICVSVALETSHAARLTTNNEITQREVDMAKRGWGKRAPGWGKRASSSEYDQLVDNLIHHIMESLKEDATKKRQATKTRVTPYSRDLTSNSREGWGKRGGDGWGKRGWGKRSEETCSNVKKDVLRRVEQMIVKDAHRLANCVNDVAAPSPLTLQAKDISQALI